MQTFNTSKTVLVVDDYEPICELIQLLLVRVGYEVHTSTTGRGAVQIAKHLPEIHLTVCGLGIQDMRAEECVEECALCHPDTAVIFISDFIVPVETSRPFAFIQKPFTIEELRTAVHGAVGGCGLM